jgi:hypothetical protein
VTAAEINRAVEAAGPELDAMELVSKPKCDRCGVVLGADDCCPECGVHHGEPCPECGRRGYHRKSCSEFAPTMERRGRLLEIQTKDGMVVLGMTTEVRDDDGHWTAYMFIPRRSAKGILRLVWREFVEERGSGGPGQAYASEPSIRRVPGYFGGWIFEQSGGLNI